MWIAEHTAETDLSPETVWTALADLHRGALTYDGADHFELHGPFAVGSTVAVTPVGQGTFDSTIVDLVEPETYADLTSFGDITLLFRHTLVALDGGGTRVTHRLEIDGPSADQVGPELGPQISDDFGPSMRSLFDAARVHA
ncbi:polyketide cyclase [Cellulomonas sp. URHD0024]|uniref:polyketide cyclase n=1 Tax=Cellulomonas sp. URHD0024 TaxID=1302620 RepID=UPI000407473D|nr:polyketide cyclase [Cellulomonas sp. URHD0024]